MLTAHLRSARLASLLSGTLLVALASTAAACDDDSDAPGSTGTPPAFLTGAVAAVDGNPLAAILTLGFDTDVAELEVTVTGTERSWTVPPTGVHLADDGLSAEVWILGCRAESTYTFEARAAGRDAGETTVAASDADAPAWTSWTSGALPDDLPPIAIETLDAARSADGVTLVAVSRADGANPFDKTWGQLLAFDADGEVVWLMPQDGRMQGHARADAGGWLFVKGLYVLEERDALGRLVAQWDAADIGIDTMHHDFVELEGGEGFLVLSSEQQEVTGYEDGATHQVVADTLARFDREGQLVAETSFFDLLDPLRISTGFFYGFWVQHYGGDDETAARDWTHANGIIPHPTDADAYLVSLRHQDLTVKVTVDPASGDADLDWTVGTDFEDFAGDDAYPWLEVTGDPAATRLPSMQHCPRMPEPGRLLLYDNGFAFGESSAVEYAVDEASGTVEEVWRWTDTRHEEPLLSRIQGTADWLEASDTVLVTHSFLPVHSEPGVGACGDGDPLTYTRIQEVTHDAATDLVFEAIVGQRDDCDGYSYMVERAVRLPSLYPPAE